MSAPEFDPALVEQAALGAFVARYGRQPVPESFDDSRLSECREYARAVLTAVAPTLREGGEDRG